MLTINPKTTEIFA